MMVNDTDSIDVSMEGLSSREDDSRSLNSPSDDETWDDNDSSDSPSYSSSSEEDEPLPALTLHGDKPFLRRRNTEPSPLQDLIRVQSEDQKKRGLGPWRRRWTLMRRRVLSTILEPDAAHHGDSIISACGTVILCTSFFVWMLLLLFPGDAVMVHTAWTGRQTRSRDRSQSLRRRHHRQSTSEMGPVKRLIRGVAGNIVHRMEQRARTERVEREQGRLRDVEALPNDCLRPDWQKHSYPTLEIHEIDLPSILYNRQPFAASSSWINPPPGYLSDGLWRTVWVVYPRDATIPTVLKMMKPEHPVDRRNLDRHSRDAIVMERLTSSAHVVDIYGHVGHSVLTEYIPLTLDVILYRSTENGHIDSMNSTATRWTPQGRLKLARDVAKSIESLHSVAGGPIVHSDLQAKQFLVTQSGTVKVNDFNRCRFMAHRNMTDERCLFRIPSAPGKSRAPEEYAYSELDEKLDVYSLAHVFYGILAGEDPWRGWSSSEVKRVVQDGYKPLVPDRYRKQGSSDEALHNLTLLAYETDPRRRISAAELAQELEKLIVGTSSASGTIGQTG